MLRNKSQNSRLHALFTNLNIDAEMKAELVLQFTNNRTERSSKMLIDECQALINHLSSINAQANGKAAAKENELENSPENRQRRKILSICHEMGWKKNGELDWERIENFLEKFGYLHKKKLNDYKPEELPKLVTQFEQLLKSYYAKR